MIVGNRLFVCNIIIGAVVFIGVIVLIIGLLVLVPAALVIIISIFLMLYYYLPILLTSPTIFFSTSQITNYPSLTHC